MTSAEALAALEPPNHAAHAAWEPRRMLTLGAARRRSAIVRGARYALIAAAGLLIAALVGQLILGGGGRASGPTETIGENVRMTNPRFTGRDADGTPFTVTAASAVRRLVEAVERTELDAPRLNYDLFADAEDGSSVFADRGVFSPEERMLDLYANVRFTTASGYAFRAEHARIFLREERVASDQPVFGSGPLGEFSADSYEIRDSGRIVILDGRVQAVLQPANAAGAAGDQE